MRAQTMDRASAAATIRDRWLRISEQPANGEQFEGRYGRWTGTWRRIQSRAGRLGVSQQREYEHKRWTRPGGGYNPGPGGSAGYPNNPPTAKSSKDLYGRRTRLGGGYNPGPGGSGGITIYRERTERIVLRRALAQSAGHRSRLRLRRRQHRSATARARRLRPECSGWKPNF